MALSDWTLAELRAIAQRRGIRLAGISTKAEAVALIREELAGLRTVEDDADTQPAPSISTGELNVEDRTARTWTCPFCSFRQNRLVTACGSCGAVLD